MGIWKTLSAGVHGLFRKREAEQELDEELRDYLDKSTGEKMRSGMTREEALRRADAELKFAEQNNIDVIFYTDARYPKRLKNINDAPILF